MTKNQARKLKTGQAIYVCHKDKVVRAFVQRMPREYVIVYFNFQLLPYPWWSDSKHHLACHLTERSARKELIGMLRARVERRLAEVHEHYRHIIQLQEDIAGIEKQITQNVKKCEKALCPARRNA